MSPLGFPQWLVLVLPLQSWATDGSLPTHCQQWIYSNSLEDPSLSQDGDVILGGLFPLYIQPVSLDMTFTKPPKLPQCQRLQEEPMSWAHAMMFAVEEINQNPFLLPGVKLGYRIMDSCGEHPWSLQGALALVSGRNHTCSKVLALIGDAPSTQCIILSRTLGPLGIPLVSYRASCACLSNRHEFPNFFRTIPSDFYQARTMAQLAKRFGWTWVGAIVSNNDYGLLAIQTFSEEVKGAGVCLAFIATLSRKRLEHDVARAASVVERSSARVILVFAWYTDVETLFLELVRRNVTGRQFLASEAWSTSDRLLQNTALSSIARGVLGVAIRSAPIPGLEEHLRSLHPSQEPGSTLMLELWGLLFGCSPVWQNSSASQLLPPCVGTETLQSAQSTFTDTSQLRTSYNIYLAVYAVAHALHSQLSCTGKNSTYGSPHCATTEDLQPRQLIRHLNRVHFTTQLGDEIHIEGGDIQAVYDIVSWQDSPDGSLKYVTIGKMKGSELHLNDSAIVWVGSAKTVPLSVCSKECPPGTRKAVRKGEPICCFDCLPCADGTISNQTGSVECKQCPAEFWSNNHRNECIPREVEFLSFEDTMGITLTTIALSGSGITVAVGVVFLYHRHTPLVKANNSELSFLLLLSLTLCFLCALVFVGRPSEWSCLAQHLVFGISFVLCLSCILVKTIVVLVAFRSARPGANMIKWFGLVQQRGSVVLFTGIQVFICILWLSLSPPYPHRNTGFQGSKLILECAVGSTLGFACVLGYIGLLAAICFLLAFLARKLPDNFNEAKFITFSMLIFCAVWIAFVPAYVSSPGKYTVAVEIFAILASSFGLLLCIFAPKCYIILLRPENNTKKFLMGKT
ncbi:extracellular calcium-sensing receptor-like isoform X1 [Anguilla anguilla]|uniref:extracellular calcium-sensing receptor-like isoform X1 n=1 Tax=Anguilla anguilla TaxID=7936 RepID=UPI0015A953A9|nr:extracellular calcium-sensing receptor-like isoform X1 [Anguilla anguilla]